MQYKCSDSRIACHLRKQSLFTDIFCFDYFVSDFSRACELQANCKRHICRCEWNEQREWREEKKEIREKRKRGEKKLLLPKHKYIVCSVLVCCCRCERKHKNKSWHAKRRSAMHFAWTDRCFVRHIERIGTFLDLARTYKTKHSLKCIAVEHLHNSFVIFHECHSFFGVLHFDIITFPYKLLYFAMDEVEGLFFMCIIQRLWRL